MEGEVQEFVVIYRIGIRHLGGVGAVVGEGKLRWFGECPDYVVQLTIDLRRNGGSYNSILSATISRCFLK